MFCGQGEAYARLQEQCHIAPGPDRAGRVHTQARTAKVPLPPGRRDRQREDAAILARSHVLAHVAARGLGCRSRADSSTEVSAMLQRTEWTKGPERGQIPRVRGAEI